MPTLMGQQPQCQSKAKKPRGQVVHFDGNVAVIKRLESAGMEVGKVEIYRKCRMTWEAATDRGPRWVRLTKTGWQITKVPPERST